ncbi:MAG TPA: hypothetical protein PLR37_11295 [Candidatus Accumulibacter phosphatis]|uniref:hypothetical protein n=1 Tax=Accumulibacter sp. TaxID=2053492 RepID=UPI0025873C37|nr:hypothetical protein [Accumulibacter sp.]HRF12700.1 hypothetical protein [Candidatus Accumulibacter phosphatis]
MQEIVERHAQPSRSMEKAYPGRAAALLLIGTTGGMMFRKWIPTVCFALFGSIADVGAQALPAPTRGELLYSTHCIACHDTQIHWRDKKLVTDWKSLQKEVRRWQELAGLGWSNEEIAQVAQYLNQRLYHLTPD